MKPILPSLIFCLSSGDGAGREGRRIARRDRRAVGLEELEEPLVPEHRHLHRLAERRPELALGERLEEGDVDHDGRRGWLTSEASRTPALDNLEEAVRSGHFTTLDGSLCDEMAHFIVKFW